VALKYKYNTKTLSYEKIERKFKDRILKTLAYATTGAIFASLFIALSYSVFDSPKEKILKQENQQLQLQYQLLNKRLDQITEVVGDIQNRDDNIYRIIFEAEPIPDNIRKAGFGGANRYKNLEGFKSSEVVIETSEKLDQITKQLYIQSKSFDEVYDLAKRKEDMLASLPSIMPIANKDLTRMSSGYGMRTHPILKIPLMHYGQDFTAKTGIEMYATGNGVIKSIRRSNRGFGNHIVIDHGYGYETLYAHLSKFNVKKGQKIKRGEIIGFVGNTGRSTAPHLHYEVHKNGKKINPINFYYNDLSPAQYEEMIKLSSAPIQSFD
jgi:murein DD-endopeptidase MepM/ murein hydrolase activator NlpD|tara:strand:+ start:2054 stop:3022 length:969 start_codon:yes stop_codon:yes gene_type:complete